MKITNTKSIQKTYAKFTVAEIKKLIEGCSDTDAFRVYVSPYFNQFDPGYTELKVEITQEV